MKKENYLYGVIFVTLIIVIFSCYNFINLFHISNELNKPRNLDNEHQVYISRTYLINYLISNYNLNSYLEIGLDDPYRNFVQIKAKEKYSVDPYFVNTKYGESNANIEKWLKFCTHRMTSDEFFKKNSKKFDIIFIDGAHEEAQVDKDIYNSLKSLNKGGFIVLHDCIPGSEAAQMIPRVQYIWNGTVWKSLVKISLLKNPNLKLYVLNTDDGCGIIQKIGSVDYKLPPPLNMSWKYFNTHKEKFYYIIQPDELSSKI